MIMFKMSVKNTGPRLLTKPRCYNKILYPQSSQIPSKYLGASKYEYKIPLCTVENVFRRSDHNNCSNYVFGKTNYIKYRAPYLHDLINRLQIFTLGWRHDSDFNIESFKRGAKQAMSVITMCIHENIRNCPYMIWAANRELEFASRSWNDLVRQNILLKPDQIHQIIILKIKKFKIDDTMVYQINTIGVCFKPLESPNNIVWEIILQCRFERNYSETVKSAWNVTKFDIIQIRKFLGKQ